MEDLAIPLILLNPAYSTSFWGFSFQFMSSTLLLLGFCSAALKTKMPPAASPLFLAAGCILINTFGGMNGAIVSFFIALAWLVCFRWIEPEISTRVGWGIRTTLSIVVISTVWIFINWHPSRASTTELSVIFTQLPDIASAFLVLLSSTPMVIPSKISYHLHHFQSAADRHSARSLIPTSVEFIEKSESGHCRFFLTYQPGSHNRHAPQRGGWTH